MPIAGSSRPRPKALHDLPSISSLVILSKLSMKLSLSLDKPCSTQAPSLRRVFDQPHLASTHHRAFIISSIRAKRSIICIHLGGKMSCATSGDAGQPQMPLASAKVAVVTTAGCPYCKRVKAALREAEIDFQELDLSNKIEVLDSVKRASGQSTVPQVRRQALVPSRRLHKM